MEFTVLGNNGPYPTANSACSGYLLKEKESFFLFDLGAGTFSRLISYIDPKKIKGIFISHWHHDHCSDLLIMDYFLQSQVNQNLKGKIPLYGPKDETSVIYRYIQTSPHFTYTPVKTGEEAWINQCCVKIGPASHPVPAVSYRVGDWAYTGDTNTTEGLADFAKGAKILLACGCVLKEQWNKQSPHLSSEKAGEIAREAKVEQLYLTHLKPTVDRETLLKEGRTTFENTIIIEEKRYQVPL